MRHRIWFLAAVMTLLAAASQAAPLTIHQEADFTAPPAQVYAALLDEKKFAGFSGLPATIDPSPGGAISMFGGRIIGRNIELVPDKRVVQAWRSQDWKPGVYSMVRFELTPRGRGTHLVLDQSSYPENDYAGLTSGWPERYWEPMKKFFR